MGPVLVSQAAIAPLFQLGMVLQDPNSGVGRALAPASALAGAGAQVLLTRQPEEVSFESAATLY
jgi:hypothetical protein